MSDAAYNALRYMCFEARPMETGPYRDQVPLMRNPGVYELHQTNRYDRYGTVYDSHLSCYEEKTRDLLWRYPLIKP